MYKYDSKYYNSKEFNYPNSTSNKMIRSYFNFMNKDKKYPGCSKIIKKTTGSEYYVGAINDDFILEDGSHFHHHQMISFGALFKYVKSGGYYILEDITEEGIDACCQRNDETYKVIFNLKETGKIENEHLLEEEIKYIENNIKQIDIYPDIKNNYRVAIIHKK